MSDLYPELGESTLGNLFMEKPDPTVERKRAAARFLNPNLLSESEESEEAARLSQSAISRRAEEFLSGISDSSQVATVATKLKEMAVRAPQNDPTDVEAGMADELSDEEDYEKARQDYDAIVQRRRNNIAAINETLQGALDSPELNRISRIKAVDEALRGTAVGKVAEMSFKARELTVGVLVPGMETALLATIMNKVKPDFKFSDLKNSGKMIQEFRNALVDLDEGELAIVLPELVDAVYAAADVNQFLAKSLIQDILADIDGDPAGTMRTVFTYLDVAGAVPLGTIGKGIGRLRNRNVEKALRGEVTGVAESSVAGVAIRTKSGAKKLGDAVVKGDDAALANVGARAEEVVDDLLVPNTFDAPITSKPYIPDAFLSETEKLGAADRAIARVQEVYGKRLDVKLNDSSIEYFDGGYEATIALGFKSGRGFKTEASAHSMARLNKMEPGQYTVEKAADSNEYFIKFKIQKEWGKDDLSAYTEVLKDGKGFAGGLLGANTHFSAEIVNSANDAAKRTANMQGAMRDVIKPYSSLSAGDKVKVNSLLREYDGVKYLSEAEMRTAGLSDNQVRAMESIYRAGKIALAETNNLARARMRDNNIKVYSVPSANRQYMAAEVDQASFYPGNKVTNLSTGEAVDFSAIRLKLEDYRLFRMMDEQGKPRFGVMPRNGVIEAGELPPMVVHNIPGYVPRRYDAPYYITKKTDDGGVEMQTVMTARDPKTASDAMKILQEEDLKAVFGIRRAQEVISQPTTWDELDSLREAGLLISGSRRKELIPDASGLDNLRGIEESIDAMIHSTGRSAGIARWTDAAIARWEAGYAQKFGDFNVAQVPKHLESNLAVQAEWRQAKSLRDHIMMMNGMHQNGVSKLTESFRHRIADGIYGMRLGGFERVLGDEISGLSSPITDAGKKAAGAMFLFLNPIRQALMQSTMIPTYAGVEGGMRYMAGGYQKDWFDIVAKRSGPMYEAWKKHGTGALVDDHIFKIGMSADSGFGLSGTFAQPLGKAIDFSKKIGFDAGTYNDKLAQFLFSANRFKSQNGRLPSSAKEWDEVAAFGENLGLNMNSSDALLSQQGVFGLLTQFMSHSIKMTGRILGKEGQFTKVEKARMAGMTALTYGTAGYGMTEVFRRAQQALGVELDPETQQAVEEGLAGMVLDTVFGLWDTDDDETRLAFSSRFSPAAGGIIGVTPDLVARMFNGTASLSHVINELPFARDPAALGAGASVTNAVTLAAKLVSRTDLPASEVSAMAASKFFESFPIYSNAMKGLAWMRHGQIVDGKGVPITDISKGSAIARSLFGIKTKDEDNLDAAMAEFHGMYTKQGQEGLKGAVRRDADATLQVLIPMFQKFADGEVTSANITKFLEQHQTAILDNLEDDELRHTYLQHLWNGLEQSGVTKSERFADQLMRSVGRDIRVEDARDLIMRNQPPGGKELVDWLNSILESRKQ